MNLKYFISSSFECFILAYHWCKTVATQYYKTNTASQNCIVTTLKMAPKQKKMKLSNISYELHRCLLSAIFILGFISTFSYNWSTMVRPLLIFISLLLYSLAFHSFFYTYQCLWLLMEMIVYSGIHGAIQSIAPKPKLLYAVALFPNGLLRWFAILLCLYEKCTNCMATNALDLHQFE